MRRRLRVSATFKNYHSFDYNFLNNKKYHKLNHHELSYYMIYFLYASNLFFSYYINIIPKSRNSYQMIKMSSINQGHFLILIHFIHLNQHRNLFLKK